MHEPMIIDGVRGKHNGHGHEIKGHMDMKKKVLQDRWLLLLLLLLAAGQHPLAR